VGIKARTNRVVHGTGKESFAKTNSSPARQMNHPQRLFLPAVSIQASPKDIPARRRNRGFGEECYCPPLQLKLPQRLFLRAVSIQALPGDNRARSKGNRSFGKVVYCRPWQLKLRQRFFLFAEAIEPSATDILAETSAIEATVVKPDSDPPFFRWFSRCSGGRSERSKWFKNEQLLTSISF
jgi:hypothetical protein